MHTQNSGMYGQNRIRKEAPNSELTGMKISFRNLRLNTLGSAQEMISRAARMNRRSPEKMIICTMFTRNTRNMGVHRGRRGPLAREMGVMWWTHSVY